MTIRRPHRGLPPLERLPPQLKEFTIRMGDADLYVNLERRVELDEAHVLYEAVLSDPEGSRLIYVDREDLATCLANSPILNPREPPKGAAGAGSA